jgi:hypothetical protein
MKVRLLLDDRVLPQFLAPVLALGKSIGNLGAAPGKHLDHPDLVNAWHSSSPFSGGFSDQAPSR